MRKLAGVCAALFLALTSHAPAALAQRATTLHDGLASARDDRAASPESVTAFGRLAREYGTPLYVYDRASILDQFTLVNDAFHGAFPKLKVFFAIKANSNPAI